MGWEGDIKLGFQGGVTPIDSIVTAATAVGQWSMVKAAQTGAVNGQSGSKVQSKTRAALFMATCRQVLQGQIADRSEVNGRKSVWSTVKTPKTAVKALTRGRSCDYSVYGSDPPLDLHHCDQQEWSIPFFCPSNFVIIINLWIVAFFSQVGFLTI